MSLNASAVGTELRPLTAQVDARWLMAYAAGLGRCDPTYFDTTRPDALVNHPLFPIAVEWGLLTGPDSGMKTLGVSPSEWLLAVHARHDLHLHRAIRPGTEVTVSAQIVGIEQTPPGGLVTIQLRGADRDGPLWTTWMGSLYRGVTVVGADRVLGTAPPNPPASAAGESDARECLSAVTVETWAPHVYSECSRIWNPIHTDLAVALAAGLPGVILHGSANLAHGVDAVLNALNTSPERVIRVGGSFRDVVAVPSTIHPTMTSVARGAAGTVTAHFVVLNDAGRPAVRDGFVVIDSPR